METILSSQENKENTTERTRKFETYERTGHWVKCFFGKDSNQIIMNRELSGSWWVCYPYPTLTPTFF